MLLWNPVPIPVFNPSTGERAAGAKAYFYVGGTITPLTVFTTDDGSAPHPWPVVADANGVFPAIFIPYGSYGQRVTSSAGTIISPTVSTIQNPAPPDSGGGGGIVVTADQIFQTGDPLWRMRSGAISGWVAMNGGTIGNAGSGGTLRANADASALFTYLFDNLSDTYAPVSGGRTTASADFGSGKTIVVPTMAGYLAGCVDNASGSAANRIQVSTTISTTNANTSATVADATGLCIGMYVVSANVPAGTTITDITGTTLTLSGNASATASGTDARFSIFPDAQTLGAVAGTSSIVQAAKQVGLHTHTTDNSGPLTHNHVFGSQVTLSYQTGLTTLDVFIPGGSAATGTNNVSLAHAHNALQNTGGQSMPNMPPTRLGTWYMKL